MFVEDKVALVTGGASGIGLCYVKELLKNGAKGVTIADVDSKRGPNVAEELSKEYKNKVIFVKTDVVNKNELEDAIKKTVEVFKNFDIIINNAGIMNDKVWEKAIDINLKGTINGCLLAKDEYIPKYRSTPVGVIVNISSIFGIEPFGGLPIYTASKHAIIGLSRSFVQPPLDRDNIKILTICPGPTATELLDDLVDKTPNIHLTKYQEAMDVWMKTKMEGMQEPAFVAEGVIKLINSANNGTVWMLENNKMSEIMIPEKAGFLSNSGLLASAATICMHLASGMKSRAILKAKHAYKQTGSQNGCFNNDTAELRKPNWASKRRMRAQQEVEEGHRYVGIS